MSQDEAPPSPTHTTLSDVILVFRAKGPGMAIDRELLATMAKGAIDALTSEMLEKRGIQSLSAETFGWEEIDTAEKARARIERVRAAVVDPLSPPVPPTVTPPIADQPSGGQRANANVRSIENAKDGKRKK